MGGKTGNRLKGCLYVRFQFYCRGLAPRRRGLAPRTPRRRGGAECTPTVRRMFAACSPHGRRMFAACSPHVRHMFTACSPHVRRIDKTVHCIISVLYVTILIKSEREKERNLTRQPNNCPFLFGMSFSLCIVLEMLLYVLRIDKPVHCIISVLYVTILIKRERAKERKSERAKERNLASHRDRLQGQAPRTPVAGGNPHAHLNGTVEHPGLPAPSQEASPPHPPSNRRGFPLPNTLASRNGTVARLNGTMRHTGLPAPSLH